MIWSFSPLGDTALLMEAQGEGNASQAVLALAQLLETNPPSWLRSVVPAIASLLTCFDPLRMSYDGVVAYLRTLQDQIEPEEAALGRLIHIPVRYGGADGPDLDAVARTLNLIPHEVMTLHCAQPYRVMMIGFAPGFPYLGPLPTALHLPRRATPRSAVPAGSVAIAAGMSGIYPNQMPGGWHLIGHTDIRLFDPQAIPPTLLTPGDMVQFTPVSARQHSRRR